MVFIFLLMGWIGVCSVGVGKGEYVMNVNYYIVNIMFLNEFEIVKLNGVKFICNYDQYFFDGRNYIVVVYLLFEG